MSTVPVVWATFGIFSARSKWFSVTIGDHGETWLYHYELETKQQSVEWWHSSLPCPKKILSAKFCWKSSHLGFLWPRWHPPHWLSSKGLNVQRRVLLIYADVIDDILEEKRRGRSPRESCSCTTMFLLTGHLQPEDTGLPVLPVPWSPTLFSGSGPVGLPPVPWLKKTTERSPFFVRRGINPEFGRCSLFGPGRAKDVSASPRTIKALKIQYAWWVTGVVNLPWRRVLCLEFIHICKGPRWEKTNIAENTSDVRRTLWAIWRTQIARRLI